MILLTILAMMLLFLVMFIVFITSVVGAGAIIIFGDVIVCIVFIVFIIKRPIRRKKK